MRLTHAEGPEPDGRSGQVFGRLQSTVERVPGDPRYTVEVRYGGYADLIGNGPDPGRLYLTIAVRGPGLGPDCAIGTAADPIRTHAVRVGDTYAIPTDPPIKVFTLRDQAFTVPAVTGGGARAAHLDSLFGLPSTVDNELTLHAAYTYRMYDALGG